MAFFADLHIHSKYSRATSKHSDLEHTASRAREKGITVVGTGDFTHPAWREELEEKLEPAEPGLFKLREELRKDLPETPGSVETRPVRFMLQVEISTIYKKGEQTRKIHHLLYAPDFEAVDRIIEQLARIGNLSADGRPILGLDSRDLLEITLEAGEECVLIPAHIWTPWFSLFGSRSGFDRLEDCYGDLSRHIFSLETGLSSDPPMNWRLSSLDDYTLVSNSDAHSPRKMGREACLFDTALNYHAMMEALRTGEKYLGTVEFYPEEGKYHLDGHRDCEVRLSPGQTRNLGGTCPECGKELTVGVLHRVHDLADRDPDQPPAQASPYRSLIPLVEILSEIEDVGPNTKTVNRLYRDLVSTIGSELYILQQAPLDQIDGFGRPMITEAIRRLRNDEVIKQAGFDGEYGTIRLFSEDEVLQGDSAGLLFEDLPDSDGEAEKSPIPETNVLNKDSSSRTRARSESDEPDRIHAETEETILGRLDADQRRAARSTGNPVLIVAGPGSGKTRTLTHRIAHLIDSQTAEPGACLAITFTRRAAGEMTDRLAKFLPQQAERVTVRTFHGLCYRLLREFHREAGLPEDLQVATVEQSLAILTEALGITRTEARTRIRQFRTTPAGERSPELKRDRRTYRRALTEQSLIDFRGLIERTVQVLKDSPTVRRTLQDRFRWISVDEFQDVDPLQYRLIRLLAPPGSNLCVIGDPDQSIYGFRGADVSCFTRFEKDYPTTDRIELTRTYRSVPTISRAALQMIEPDSLVGNRRLEPVRQGDVPNRLQECPTGPAEAEFVVKSIERMIGGTSFFSFDSRRVGSNGGEPLSFSDIGVLYRTRAQAEPLAEAFDRSGIPYRKHSHRPLHEHPTVQFLLERMTSGADDASPEERFDRAVEAWREDNEATDETHRITEALRREIRSLEGDVEALQSELALGLDVDLWDPRAQGVSLLTLHASKGLEFRVVFVVGCEDGFLPFRKESDGTVDRAEERRLLFVGMTRAEDQLILSYANRRKRHGTVRQRDPSPFLNAIDDTLIEKASSTEEWSGPRSSKPEASSTQLDLL